ncbi:CHAT domain-containing protein [Streptacidiphilus sp. PAMC 29251]
MTHNVVPIDTGEWRSRAPELISRGRAEGRAEPLVEAVALLVEAASADPAGRGDCAALLGAALLELHELTGERHLLVHALGAHRAALGARPSDPRRLSNLGICLTRWYEHTGDADSLDEAVAVLRAAVTEAPENASGHANLGLALMRRAERTGDGADAVDAVEAHTLAVRHGPDVPGTRAAMLANLGAALMVLFRRTGDREQLSSAVARYRESVLAVPEGDPRAAGCRAGLGDALTAEAAATGSTGLLLEAIEVLRGVVRDLPPEHPDSPVYLNQLAAALRIGFARNGDTLALKEAVDCRRAAVDRTPASHPDRLLFTANLAVSLRNWFEYTADPAALGEASDLLRAVVDQSPPEHPERVKWRADYANTLHRLGVHRSDPDVLAEAAAALRLAVAEVEQAHPDRAMHLANLGSVLNSLIGLRWDPDLQAEAVAVLSAAAELAAAVSAPQEEMLLSLGLAHLVRLHHDGSVNARGAAVEAFRTVVGTVAAAPRTRAVAAQHIGRIQAATKDFAGALTGFDQALDLLSLVAWRGLQRDDQERLLVEFSGLAGAAAACALELGDPPRALAVLEQGRGVLLGQVLDLRTDHEGLRRRHPELAGELEAVYAGIDAATEPPSPSEPPAEADLGLRRQRLAMKSEDVLARIRENPGFRHFLSAPDPALLLDAARSGPVVTLNLAGGRCDALVTTLDGTEAVPLPDLTAVDATERANAFVAAVNANAWGTNRAVREVLEWLWDTVTGPVLDHLGLPESDSTELPRLWWVPTGALSVLPLHAAGHHSPGAGNRRSALHRVASSYTPTLRFLCHVRDGATDHRPAPALVVAVGAGAVPLTQAAAEADLVSAALSGPVVRLVDQEATRAAVLDLLPGAGHVHFACHATTDAARPSDSCLHLADRGTLRIREIGALRVPSGRIVYLSACTTALGSGRLPDETIHLSSAFQQAGFATAIGTLWRVPDRASREAAEFTYAALTEHSPARAVNLSARRLREKYRANPYEWAAFVHSGPM